MLVGYISVYVKTKQKWRSKEKNESVDERRGSKKPYDYLFSERA